MEDVLTEFGRDRLVAMHIPRAGETVRAVKTRARMSLKALLRNAADSPIINTNAITPTEFMEYILSIRHRTNNSYLSRSAYGTRRSSLFHLFRAHNRLGFPEAFRMELNALFRGFFVSSQGTVVLEDRIGVWR